MKRTLLLTLVMLVALLASVQNVAAVCSGGFPDFYYGDVTIDGSDAPIGTDIRAMIDGELAGTYETTAVGVYGNPDTDDKMLVSGNPAGYDDFPTIQFQVFAGGSWEDAGTDTYTCGDIFEQPKNADLAATSASCDDDDGDGVCNDVDICEGGDDNVDVDGDGTPDFCDACPADNPDDTDGDGVCDSVDLCVGDDASGDSDADGTCDDTDVCPLDEFDDADADGVCGDVDQCEGFDDNLDIDSDGIPDGCDDCTDIDGDGFCDDVDCDDTDALINPDALEICDGVDNNCDAVIDTDATDMMTYYPDLDGDDFGAGAGVDACVAPEDHADNDLDCNDTDVLINPDADEICDDGIDNDCDGDTDEADSECVACPDDDGDGVCNDVDVCDGDDASGDTDGDGICDDTDLCTDVDGDGFCLEGLDCNDTDVAINPDATEVCNGIDDDCDALIDDDDGDLICDEGTTVEITIYEGWTLFALPLDPINADNSEELGALINADGGNCDVIMTYDGVNQTMVDDILGLADPTFPLSSTAGYFVGCDSATTFDYQGLPWE